MNKYFVYYSDGYDDEGLSVFESEQAAVEFIEDRLKVKGSQGQLEDYTLIKGKHLQLVPVSLITKLKVVS